MASSRQLRVENPAESRARVEEVLDDRAGPAREIVVFNAAAALYAADVVDSIASGIGAARAVIASGAAREKLHQFVAATRRLAGGAA
jgi:anthranilate phosphoribosyltransferase